MHRFIIERVDKILNESRELDVTLCGDLNLLDVQSLKSSLKLTDLNRKTKYGEAQLGSQIA